MIPGLLATCGVFFRSMDDYFAQFVRGMVAQGWKAMGRGLSVPPGDVAAAAKAMGARVVVAWPRHYWDGRYAKAGVALADHLTGWQELADQMPGVFRVSVLHDAGTEQQRLHDWHAEFRPHAYLVWYSPESILRLWPDIPADRLIRTYHSIDADACLEVCPRLGVGVLSGATGLPTYPLRTRLYYHWAAGRTDGWLDYLSHPGYGQVTQPGSTAYVRRLARFRVAVCTASTHGFALRKIIEATAAGCRVVTDLPVGDILPEIDGNLTRVSPDESLGILRLLVTDLAADWDLERQKGLAEAARKWYDYRQVGRRAAADIAAAADRFAGDRPCGS